MAITATNLTTDGTNASGGSVNTASISPSQGTLIIASVANVITSGTPAIPTLSGNSIIWHQAVTAVDNSTGIRRVTIFYGQALGPTTGVIKITISGSNQSDAEWSIDQFSNASGIVQSASNANNGTQTGLTITLSSSIGSGNAVYGFIRKNTSSTITAGASFTTLSDQMTGGHTQAQWILPGQTTIPWTWSSESAISVAVGVEIQRVSSAFFPFF